MSLIPEDVFKQIGLSPEQCRLFHEREKSPIFAWFVEERYVIYLSANLNIVRDATKEFLVNGMGLDEPDQLTDFEIDDKVACKLGGVSYPTDSMEQGKYLHFKDGIPDAPDEGKYRKTLRENFRPTDENSPFYAMYRKIHGKNFSPEDGDSSFFGVYRKIHRKRFRPTDENSPFFRMMLRKVKVVERLDEGDHGYRAKTSKDSHWSYGTTLGQAVCLAFLGLPSRCKQ